MPDEPSFRFVPSRVEGLPDVTEAVVRPDRLDLLSAGRWVTVRFADIARWPQPAWIWRLSARLGWRRHWPTVADRDWFHPPAERFFAFYSTPRIVIYMPDEHTATEYGKTSFRRLQDVLMAGGFTTFDLG